MQIISAQETLIWGASLDQTTPPNLHNNKKELLYNCGSVVMSVVDNAKDSPSTVPGYRPKQKQKAVASSLSTNVRVQKACSMGN